jgi:predicted nucleic-acid-binding protein
MMLVDTNVVLRWLLGDHKKLSAQAEKIVQVAKPASLIVTDIVVAEVVYVLRGTGRDREQTSEALLLVERTGVFKFENEELILEVIGLLTRTKLDFADCYLYAKTRREKLELITFDASLQSHSQPSSSMLVWIV